MKYLPYLLLLILASNLGIAQSNLLCNLTPEFSLSETEINSTDSSIQIMNDEEIYLFVENLMKTLNLPMTLQIRKCKSCKKNAYAGMGENGTRFIKYNEDFFEEIRKESTKIGILTILAHEIGHHLSAHTLSLNQTNYKEAIKFCKKSKKNVFYDRKICDSLYKKDYADFKGKQRGKELEADRFSGFIMNVYGAELDQIKNSWVNLHDGKEQDDSNSTHPKLSKRLTAVQEGYKLAEKYKNSKKKIDIHEIKGNPEVEVKLKQKDLDVIANKNLISDIHGAISSEPVYILNRSSKQ